MQNIKLNLRGKLLVIVLIGLISGFGMVASFRIHWDKLKITEDINRSGNERVTLIAESVANLLVASDYSSLQSLSERFVKLQDVERINILDIDGKILISQKNTSFTPAMKGSVFEAPVVSAGKTIGSVQMFVSLDRLHQAVHDIYRVVAVGISLTTLFFGLVIYAVVSVLVVRPLVQLSEAADQLALGNYSAVLPEVTQDELGNLAHAFSSMRESRRLSEEKLSAIFYNAPDAFIQLDCNGDIVNWNDQAANIFGYSKIEAVGRNFSMVMPAEELGLNSGYRKCYQQSENIISVIREVVGRRSDGSHFPLELRTSEINFADARLHCFRTGHYRAQGK
ncbi:MAG TPA: PAS domain S-box protein [Gallionellaceae bacterium]|nr:PAS domain S-box protein [Gallionellaceae bacterium]